MDTTKSTAKKKKGTNSHSKSSSGKKVTMKKKTIRKPTHEIIVECPKEKKDCESCERLRCPEEKV